MKHEVMKVVWSETYKVVPLAELSYIDLLVNIVRTTCYILTQISLICYEKKLKNNIDFSFFYVYLSMMLNMICTSCESYFI